MKIKTKNFKEGKADTGLLFVAGIFFLTLAFAGAYFSHFGLALLPKEKMNGMKAPVASVSAPSEQTNLFVNVPATPDEKFIASLSQTQVKEIFIGSYGSVDKEILFGIRDEAEKTFGVKITLLNPGAAIPKEAPFYDKNRKQYDGDALMQNIEKVSVPYGQTVRFLYFVDFDMGVSSGGAPSSAWFRANKGTNAALISLSGLRAKGSLTAKGVLSERAKKVAWRALGITVGFGASPSATNSSCLMYPALTIKELDAEAVILCSSETEAISRVFVR